MTTIVGKAKKRFAVRVAAALVTAVAATGIISFGSTGGSSSAQAATADCPHDHNFCLGLADR